MTQVIADTNVFLRFLLKDIPHQFVQAKSLFKKAEKSEILVFIPQIVIFEAFFALEKYYNFPKTEIIDKLQSLLAVKYFSIQDRQAFELALNLFEENDISLTDCFIVSLSRTTGAEIFTFDKKLGKYSA